MRAAVLVFGVKTVLPYIGHTAAVALRNLRDRIHILGYSQIQIDLRDDEHYPDKNKCPFNNIIGIICQDERSNMFKIFKRLKPSFYRNFDSMDDVIESIANDIIRDFNTDIVPIIKENDERKWRELLFETLYRPIQIQKKMGASFCDFARVHANNSVIMDRIHDKILLADSELPATTTAEKYAVIGKMNLIHGIVRQWVMSGMQETPEEIIDIIMPMVMKLK